ncbi:VOC family protein [Candidatus Izemoplasma sp. B36]|uniref:VOC family protein n=1 Tax=Candidatus Izemoplasma sp. B36 TaxID=3242468 RepID=UPI00355668DD
MFRYSSNITFIYYNDFDYGINFFENILDLKLIMDQGFARVYQVNEKAFLGIVKLNQEINYTGNTLVSLSTDDVQKEYQRISKLETFDITEIKNFPNIPLNSFFFKDKEGHDFEIQQFLKSKDLKIF